MIDEQGEEPLELTSDEELTQTETGENGTGEEEVAEAEAEEPKAEEKPKGKSVQERIDELYGKAKDAEREAEFWRSKALGQQPQPQAEPEPEARARPSPDDYAYGDADPAYQEALIDWKAEQLITKRLAEFSEKQAVKLQATELDRTYAENLAKVKEEIPDYDEVVTKGGKLGKWACSEEMAGLIKTSPVGPKVAHYLATNPEQSGYIAQLPSIQQAAAFGMLAAQLAEQPAPKANIATNAPAPAPARTKGGQFAPTNELRDDLDGKEWLKRREAQVRSRA